MADDFGPVSARDDIQQDDDFPEIVVELEELDPILDADLIVRSDADYAAGRFVPHEKVAAWLDSIGGPNELPVPYSWRE